MFERATEAAKANRCKFNMRIRYICEVVRKNWENICEANFEKTLLPIGLVYQSIPVSWKLKYSGPASNRLSND